MLDSTTNPIKLDTIRTLRIKHGWTQREAAERFGVGEVTLRSWEKDSTNITISVIKKIEKVYGAPQDQIFFGKESTFSELVRANKQNDTA